MKKLLLASASLLWAAFSTAQTTATNFTCNDCSGTSHTLFNELDAGKVIVLVWVMPCATCIGPSQSAYTTAQSFSSSYPGRVLFWLADDYANSSCSTLSSWATTNSMPNSTKFSNAAINMNDYGSTGMPKVVILGGASHTVYYNANSTFSASAMQTAIQNALNASTGLSEESNTVSSPVLFPNPANAFTSLSYSLNAAGSVRIDLYNQLGEKIQSVFSGRQSAGEQKITIDSSNLANGNYYIKMWAGKQEKTIALTVAH